MPDKLHPPPATSDPGRKAGKKSPPVRVQAQESSSHDMVVDLEQDFIVGVIEDCKRGDDAAFQALFERYKDKVYSIALRYAGDPAAAMDIAQDTFLKLMDRIGQFRGESSFDSWLYRLVVNACLDHRRRQQRWMPSLDEFFDTFRAPQASPLDGLLRDEKQQQVQDVVAKLPPDQRVCVILRYTEGLSYDEIAEALDCSRGTVASRLSRAHKFLERRLGALAARSGA